MCLSFDFAADLSVKTKFRFCMMIPNDNDHGYELFSSCFYHYHPIQTSVKEFRGFCMGRLKPYLS